MITRTSLGNGVGRNDHPWLPIKDNIVTLISLNHRQEFDVSLYNFSKRDNWSLLKMYHLSKEFKEKNQRNTKWENVRENPLFQRNQADQSIERVDIGDIGVLTENTNWIELSYHHMKIINSWSNQIEMFLISVLYSLNFQPPPLALHQYVLHFHC